MVKIVLDKSPKKVWNLNQLKMGETFTGVPTAEYYENKKGHMFIHIMLDAGYSICHIYILIFSFPEQKVLNKNIYNSFQLVRFYREVNGIPVDDNITQLHDINWQEIIDWINQKEILKIQVISKNMAGFRNIKFLPTVKLK